MLWLGIHAFVIALWSGVFWGTIWLVDRHNPKNSFGLAFGLGVIFDFTHAFGIPDLFYLIAWLVFLARLVSWHHNLGIVQTLIVTASTVFTPMYLAKGLVKWVGDSPLRDSLVLYGLPVVVFGAWGYAWFRARAGRPVPVEEGGLPQARVEKIASEKKPARAPAVAPAPPPPPRPDGEPSILG